MFQEGEGSAPEAETIQRREQDVVFKGTVEKPKKESWWERTFGGKKTSADESIHQAAATQPAEVKPRREVDVKRLTAREVAERERTREIRRKIDLDDARKQYVPPKPQEKEPDTVSDNSDNKEAPRIEDEPGL